MAERARDLSGSGSLTRSGYRRRQHRGNGHTPLRGRTSGSRTEPYALPHSLARVSRCLGLPLPSVRRRSSGPTSSVFPWRPRFEPPPVASVSWCHREQFACPRHACLVNVPRQPLATRARARLARSTQMERKSTMAGGSKWAGPCGPVRTMRSRPHGARVWDSAATPALERTNCSPEPLGADPATFAHRPGRSGASCGLGRLPLTYPAGESYRFQCYRALEKQRHERVVGWNGAGSQEA